MTTFEVVVWLLDIGLLTRILIQGEIIIRNDKERLDLERENHRMARERYEERAKWRKQKQKLQLKNSGNADNGSGKTTDGP